MPQQEIVSPLFHSTGSLPMIDTEFSRCYSRRAMLTTVPRLRCKVKNEGASKARGGIATVILRGDQTGQSLGIAPEKMEIKLDDLTGPEIARLLAEHLQCMTDVTPESIHALNLDRLR